MSEQFDPELSQDISLEPELPRKYSVLKFVCRDAQLTPANRLHGKITTGMGCHFETESGAKIDFCQAYIEISANDIIRAFIEVPLSGIEKTTVAGRFVGRDMNGNEYDCVLREKK